jgi:hypothetical protein
MLMSFRLSKIGPLALIPFLLCFTACGRDKNDADTSSIAITSPSGAASVVKTYYGDEQIAYDLQLRISHGADSTSTQILPSQNVDWASPDGIVLGWENDRHLTVSWPNGFQPIHGQEHVGDIHISYRPHEPDIDRISGHKPHNLRLHDTSISFKELNSQYGDARYATTNEPVPNTKCIVEISGADGDAFEEVTVQIIGNGIGRVGDEYPGVGMVSVNYVFTKVVGHYASLTPTQAKLGSIYPHFPYDSHPPVKTVMPVQTNHSLHYHSYGPSEALNLFAWLQKGKLDMKVGLNFGQEILHYEADVSLGKDIIDKFNACSSKTNIYTSPGDIHSTPFQVPYSPKTLADESTSSFSKASGVIPAFHIGESFDDFMADVKLQGYTNATIDVRTRSADGDVTMVSLGTSGIRLFFANTGNHELENIRYDPPYSGKVHGIGLGDSLNNLSNMLGSPVKPPWKFGDKSVYIYAGKGNRYDRFDIGNGVVETIFVIR